MLKKNLTYELFEESLKSIIEATQIGLWDWHLPSGKVFYCQQWKKILGYNDESTALESGDKYIIAEDLPNVEKALDDYLKGKTNDYIVEFRVVYQDGSIVWVQNKGTIIQRDVKGNPLRMVGIVQDITRLKLTKQSLDDLEKRHQTQKEIDKKDELLRSANQISSLLLMESDQPFEQVLWRCFDIVGRVINVDRVYLWENHIIDGKLYCRQTSEWSEGAKPQQGNEYTMDVEYDVAMPRWQETLKVNRCINSIVREMSQAEQSHLVPQGIISILIAPIFIKNDFWGFIGFDDCRNERIFTQSEENILQTIGSLITSAKLREEMNRKLVMAKEEALNNAKAKTTFLANMAHELRVPMNAIIGMTKIAQMCESPNKTLDSLEKIEGASKHLLSILNDILDMSNIDSDKFTLNMGECDLTKMVENIYNIFAGIADEKGQILTVNIDKNVPVNIITDELRLTQVINNFLSNAIKFTPDGGNVKLIISKLSEDQENVKLKILVSDSGIGIPKNELAVLFSTFAQLDNGVTRKFGGTGLGLTISKKIIDLMDGKLYVESEIGEGSKFILHLDFKKTPKHIKKDEGRVQLNHDFTGKSILLVEDIEINREVIIELLAGTKAEIDVAENGLIAFEKVITNLGRYDLIFMDIHMPILDGYGATKKIRRYKSEYTATVPIVAMTTNAFAEDIVNCRSAGMNDHIVKPVDLEEVIIKMNKYIKE